MSCFLTVLPFQYPGKHEHHPCEENSLTFFQIPFPPASFLGSHILHPLPLRILKISLPYRKQTNKQTNPLPLTECHLNSRCFSYHDFISFSRNSKRGGIGLILFLRKLRLIEELALCQYLVNGGPEISSSVSFQSPHYPNDIQMAPTYRPIQLPLIHTSAFPLSWSFIPWPSPHVPSPEALSAHSLCPLLYLVFQSLFELV